MEGCKVLSSKTIPLPVRSITACANGIFTNSCRPLINNTTLHDTRSRDVRDCTVCYDICLSNRPHEVKDAVGNISIRNNVGTFKESFMMVKNAIGCYVLPDSYKPNISRKKECKFDVNDNRYLKQNGIPCEYYPSSEKFKVKTPVTNELKSDVKEEFNPKDFILAVNTHNHMQDNRNPVQLSWSEVVKANSSLMSQHKPGCVPKDNMQSDLNYSHYLPSESAKFKGIMKKEFNPYAKNWIPKSKNIKKLTNFSKSSSKFGSSVKGHTPEAKLVDIKDKRRETRILISKDFKSNSKSFKTIKKVNNLENEVCTHRVDVNNNIYYNSGIQIPNYPTCINPKDVNVEDITSENKEQDATMTVLMRKRSIDEVESAGSIPKKSELHYTGSQVMIKPAGTANYSEVASNANSTVPFVADASIYCLEDSLIECPVNKFDSHNITNKKIIYKGNEETIKKVREEIKEINIREKEEINNDPSLKIDMSFAQLITVRETIENIKRSNGLFMVSSGTFEVAAASTVNMTKPPIWSGLHWVSEPSRWLCVSNFPFESEYYPDLRLLFEAYGDVREIHCGFNGIAYVFYYDIRDAIKAQNLLKHKEAPHNRGRLNVRFGQKPTNINNLVHLYPSINLQELQNEGSLIISYYGAYASESAIKAQFSKCGTIKEFKSQTYEDVRVITLEYYDSRNANSAKRSLNGQKIQGAILAIEFHDPSAQSWDIITNEISGRQKPPKPAIKGYPAPPVTSTVHSSGNRTIPLRNRMNLEKVKQGLDVRTTFMVRNIPNKYTQEMLIAELNDTHKGKYDFLYLRIDFTNKCNVGYAFINFVDISAVISFAESRVGRKWTCFNSDKICELSYADVQGYPTLVEKFRTSSIMRERPEYRPKVFFTSGPMRGMEAPFPCSLAKK
ncbi:uncharacterized protein OCT59_017991 [Rhizophagus irregularis]|uniref:RRM domain-containing protein n=3 Tax=Rhizophagus irregularis TaxID=588596 RepID=A0A916DWU5_9GLOM|nr:hypothetical protein RirG_203020 [Rhizophagus irregularis DAOM 197198w]UZO25730.1 hypothetical protein OCT59_017991 [Rhizophagus irregularis]GBC41568.1 meiosis protein MEI2 [Rhizophagus irregularis DAOM 181602=DAOM 197198]CAB5209623.1 unnamed protein product [Rhizophagus irregularis]CAB5291078.1 unnamed protein product [Rhizophagus irregularis]